MKLATLAGALVLTAALAAPALAEAGYCARPYASYYYGPSYYPYRYGYYAPYRHYYRPYPYLYGRAYVRPYYRPRARFHFGVWW